MINNFLKLSWKDKQLIIKTLFLMIFVRLMLWIIPFTYIHRFFNKKNINKRKSYDYKLVDKLIWAVKSVTCHVPKTTCLTDALTAQTLLKKHGYPSLVKIGVGKDANNQFKAHAWLEYAGEVVIGESNKDYVPIFDLNQINKEI